MIVGGNNLKKVQVLLSTYNGEKFIKEQLTSLANQTYKNIEILVRDDGSKDNTVVILDGFKKDFPSIEIIKGENVGVKRSFLDLLSLASEEADYFFFCDQDDFWEKDKISSAVSMMEKENQAIPIMYFSKLKIVDQKLNLLRESPDPEMGIGYENAIIQNIATGCTIGINQAMVSFVKLDLPNPDKIVMHDAWIYLVAAAFGKIIYEDKGHILYRQHDSNAVGMTTSKFSGIQKRYEHFKVERKTKPYTSQAGEFYTKYENQLDKEKHALLHDFLFSRQNMFQRWSFLRKTNLYRQTAIDTAIYKICYLNNWY